MAKGKNDRWDVHVWNIQDMERKTRKKRRKKSGKGDHRREQHTAQHLEILSVVKEQSFESKRPVRIRILYIYKHKQYMQRMWEKMLPWNPTSSWTKKQVLALCSNICNRTLLSKLEIVSNPRYKDARVLGVVSPSPPNIERGSWPERENNEVLGENNYLQG